MNVGVVIVASGKGSRMGEDIPKQFLRVGNQSILEYSLDFFQKDTQTKEMVLVLPEAYLSELSDSYQRRYSKLTHVVAGGQERIDSVRCGARYISAKMEVVAVHDGVRPFVSSPMWIRLLERMEAGDVAVIPGIDLVDTIKSFQGDLVERTWDRRLLRAVQTPQVFARKTLLEALASAEGGVYTDEASLVESRGVAVRMVEGDVNNRKITKPEDLYWMRQKCLETLPLRVGLGYDVHRLQTGLDLVLGGVKIKSKKGLLAHSDGDVLAHAVMDALLGALALGDIGQHFPDTDESFRKISSLVLLEKVYGLIQKNGYRVNNLDVVLVAENPKLAPYLPIMRENLASVLHVDIQMVGIQATTTEKLGFCGREEGMAAQAVCTLVGAV